MERLDRKEQSGDDGRAAIAREQFDDPPHEQRVTRMEQKIRRVKHPGVDSRKRRLEFIAHERERYIELRIVAAERSKNVSHRPSAPDDRILRNEERIVPAGDEPKRENVVIDKDRKSRDPESGNPERYHL